MNTWQPTGFSAGEFARMQQDAERRVEEMRRRARQSTGEPEHTYSAPVQTIQPGDLHLYCITAARDSTSLGCSCQIPTDMLY